MYEQSTKFISVWGLDLWAIEIGPNRIIITAQNKALYKNASLQNTVSNELNRRKLWK